MHISFISLEPDCLQAFLGAGLFKRALAKKLLSVRFFNPRDYSDSPHRRVDDRPYGGGPGMLLQVLPLRAAIQAARQAGPEPALVIYPSPQGPLFKQAAARHLALATHLIFVCGRYEGIDERLIALENMQELSIGDYVLSQGDLAALVVCDSVLRYIPGSLGNVLSSQEDSFSSDLLEGPQYTRPEVLEDMNVPEVLLSGDHRAIAQWRLKQQLGRTYERRADLFERRDLNDQERALLAAYLSETKGS